MSDVIFTRLEAAERALAGYTELRDQVRAMALEASGETRQQLLDVACALDEYRDRMLSRFGVPSPADPVECAVRVGDPVVVSRPVPDRVLRRVQGNRGHHAESRSA